MMIIGNSRGTRDVAVQDQTTPIVDLHFTKQIDTAVILALAAIDDNSINIQTATAPIVGDVVNLKDPGSNSFYQGEILVVTPLGGNDYTAELDTPLDFGFGPGDFAETASNNLAVDGSVTPQIFGVSPTGLSDDTEWDITRFMANMLGNTTMDDGLFGDLPPLAKGIVIRADNGIVKNIFNAKTNGQIKEHVYDLVYESKSPAGQTGLSLRRSFGGQDKNGVVTRITAAANDGIKCIIQDNLTGLNNFGMVAEGHVVNRGMA